MVDAVPEYGARRGSREPARDARLLALHRNGMTGADIARVLGITRERVRQIVKRETGESVRKTFLRTCRYCGVRHPNGTPSVTAHNQTPEHRAAIRERRITAFWKQVVERPDGCWDWLGYHDPQGYAHCGAFKAEGGGGYGHRVAYVLTNGPIAKGLCIDHLCRNRGCLNPAHLEAVTPRENILRSPVQVAALNARKTHCKRGHPFAGDNLVTDGRSRRCLACSAIRSRRVPRRQEIAA